MEVEWERQSNALKESIAQLAQLLHHERGWLIGGSCSLWLQGIPIHQSPRDIDIYADERDIGAVHNTLNNLALDIPCLDETGMYKSILSHYQLGEYTVELVGGFEVRSHGSHYAVNVRGLLEQAAPKMHMEGYTLHLMPLAHELVFNLLRDRTDRYVPIAHAIKTKPIEHRKLLIEILQSNLWSKSHQAFILDVLS